MPLQPNPAVLAEFQELIEAQPANENALQAFLETHTAFLETPHLLNHQLHFNCVISKLQVGVWSTDLAYLTKSTTGWRVVLVELERPDKKLFQAANAHLAPSADFARALAQVDTWRDQWDANKAVLLDKLAPLLVPYGMHRNPVTPYYVLIMGRDDEFRADDAKKRRLEAYNQEKRLHVMTYDTLRRTYEEGRSYPKCILSPIARGYRIKHLDGEPSSLFGHVEPQHLDLSAEAEAQLVKWGFDIPSWRQGELLTYNQKLPLREAAKLDNSAAFQKAIQRALRRPQQEDDD